MDPDVRSDVQPVFLGDTVLYGGRVMRRARGAESSGGAPAAAGGGEGEGQGGTDLGLYDLSEVPEHLRPHVEPHLKKWEGNVTQKFQEAAEFRKQFEPLAAVEGLTDVPPERIAELIEFERDYITPIAQGDHSKFEEWWRAMGEHLGFLEEEEAGGEGDGEETTPEVAELRGHIAELTQKLEQIEGRDAERETSERQRAVQAEIRSQLDALHGHEDFPTREDGSPDDDVVLRLAFAYGGEPDAVDKAFKDYLRIAGKAQGELVKEKLDQPAAALQGGSPNTSPPEIRTFREAREAAKARAGAPVG